MLKRRVSVFSEIEDTDHARVFRSTVDKYLAGLVAFLICTLAGSAVWRSYRDPSFSWQYDSPAYVVIGLVLGLLMIASILARRSVGLDKAQRQITVTEGLFMFEKVTQLSFDKVAKVQVTQPYLGQQSGNRLNSLSLVLHEGPLVPLAYLSSVSDAEEEAAWLRAAIAMK